MSATIHWNGAHEVAAGPASSSAASDGPAGNRCETPTSQAHKMIVGSSMINIYCVFVDLIRPPSALSCSPSLIMSASAAAAPAAAAAASAALPKWKDPPGAEPRKPSKEELLLNFVFAEAKEGDVNSVIDTIDRFCHQDNQWMMNGPLLRAAT